MAVVIPQAIPQTIFTWAYLVPGTLPSAAMVPNSCPLELPQSGKRI